MDTNQMTLSQFCDIQGVNDNDRFALGIHFFYTGIQSYDQWYADVSHEIVLSPKKDFAAKISDN